ncbi:hypothetical protein F66182_4868, partial [Fusarium sp. NRRL 66182]
MRATLFALAALPFLAAAQDPINPPVPAVPEAAPTTTTSEAPIAPPPAVDTSSSEAPVEQPPTTTEAAIVVPETTSEAVPDAPETTSQQPVEETTSVDSSPPFQDTTTEQPPPAQDTTTQPPPPQDTTTDLPPAADTTTQPIEPQPETTSQEPPAQDTTTTEAPVQPTTTSDSVPGAQDTTTEAVENTPLPETTTQQPPAQDTTTELPVVDTTTQQPPVQDTTTSQEPVQDTTTQQPPAQDTTTDVPPVDTTTQQPPAAETTTSQQPPVQDTTTAPAQPDETTSRADEPPAPTSEGEGESEPTITEAPVLTTAPPAAATSTVSAVSSRIADLIPIINSWSEDPENLKDQTNQDVEDVHDDIIAAIVFLGGKPDVGCAGKKKRGLLGSIGDIINNLACMAKDLTDISGNIIAGNVPAVTGAVAGVQAKNDELTDEQQEEEEEKSEEKSEEESTKQEETSQKESSTEAPSTTEAPTSTEVTTTTEAPTTTGIARPCSPDTCGNNACPLGGEELKGDEMKLLRPEESDCGSLSTSTIDGPLPTAPGNSGSGSGTPVERGLAPRALPTDNTSPNPLYVASLTPVPWVSQNGLATGQFFRHNPGFNVAGVNGVYGCTSVIIVSEKGVYLSHIWEGPVFINPDWSPTSDDFFRQNSFERLRDGVPGEAQSITSLIGTDAQPGPLHAFFSPKVYVLTPYTDLTLPVIVNTRFQYQQRAEWLASQVSGILPGSGGSGEVLGYTRTNAVLSTMEPGWLGRAIIEIDTLQYVMASRHDPNGLGLAVGRWRLWVEDRLITFQDFWLPNFGLNGFRKRQEDEQEPSNKCLILGDSAGTTTSAEATSTDATSAQTTEDVKTTETSSEESTKAEETTSEKTTTADETTTTEKPSEETTSTAQQTAEKTTSEETTPETTTRPPTTLRTTTSAPETTTTDDSFKGPYPCVNFGGPRVATPYCQCSTTTAGQTFITSAPHISGRCDYTENP